MIFWVVVAVIGFLALIGFAILAWVRVNSFDRYNFGYWIHVFAKYRQDNSKLTFKHAGSSANLQLLRTRGVDDQCTLILRVPRGAWSERKQEKLKDVLAGMGREPQKSGEVQSDWLLETPILVEDVRKEDSSAAPARIAHRILDALDLGSAERFSCKIEGLLSSRYKFEARESDY